MNQTAQKASPRALVLSVPWSWSLTPNPTLNVRLYRRPNDWGKSRARSLILSIRGALGLTLTVRPGDHVVLATMGPTAVIHALAAKLRRPASIHLWTSSTAVDPRWRAETTPGASVRPEVFRYLSWRNRLHCASTLAPAPSKAGAWLEWLGAVATRPLQSLVRGSPRHAGRTLRILMRAGLDAARGRLGIPPAYVLRGSDVTATRLSE